MTAVLHRSLHRVLQRSLRRPLLRFGGTARRLAPVLALSLGGEAAQSGFHFAINVALARALGAEDYGVFAIVMVVGAIALTYQRAVVGMPAALAVAAASTGPGRGGRAGRRVRAAESAFGSAAALLALAVTALAAPLFALWLSRAGLPAALAGALFVGLWSFRSYLRAVALAAGRPAAALASDLTFAGTGTALAGTATLLFRPAPGEALAAAFLLLAAANFAGSAAALAGGGARPRFTARRSVRARFLALRRQLAWSAAATTTANMQATGQVLLVAALGGPGVYAPMAAMLALFAPVRLLVAGLTNMLLPELARREAAPGPRAGMGRPLAAWTACALAVGLLYGAVAAAALPLMGTAVFAGQPRALIFALAWATTATFFLSLVPRLLLEVRRRFRAAAAIGTAGALAGMTLVVLVLWSGHPALALSGNLLAEAIVLAGSWAAVAGIPAGPAGLFGRSAPRPRTTRGAAGALPAARRAGSPDQ